MKQNKIYVGNLVSSFNIDDIKDEFSRYGELENVQLITDRNTGLSRGFAFLTYEKQVAAETALEMNGKVMNGRNLVVHMAKEKNKFHRRKSF